jgi:photosystem II stability/assembly factor-like uncharacterized protein
VRATSTRCAYSGNTVYAIDGVTSLLFVSTDAGRNWAWRKPPVPLVDLAVDPADANHLVAAGKAGLYESPDAGASWLALPVRIAGYLGWNRDGRLFLLDGAGNLSVATDRGNGRSWTTSGSVGDEPEAFLVDGDSLYAALHHGVVKVSRDGGETWVVRSRKTG